MNFRYVHVLLALFFIWGCGGPSTTPPSGVAVSGTVQLASGAPITGGILVLRPIGSLHGASAIISSDGTFTLKGPNDSNSVVPGKYMAYVRFPDEQHKALRNQVNLKYQNTEDSDSDVIVEIKEAQSDLIIKFGR